MNALDARSDAQACSPQPRWAGQARILASALIQVLGRDEPPPARWNSRPFCEAVAHQRSLLAAANRAEELDAVQSVLRDATFRGAAIALAADPHAVALAVRRLELLRGAALPPWPEIVRHGVLPRVTHAEQARWFG